MSRGPGGDWRGHDLHGMWRSTSGSGGGCGSPGADGFSPAAVLAERAAADRADESLLADQSPAAEERHSKGRAEFQIAFTLPLL